MSPLRYCSVRRLPKLFMIFSIVCMIFVALTDLLTEISGNDKESGSRNGGKNVKRGRRNLAANLDDQDEEYLKFIGKLVNGAKMEDPTDLLMNHDYRVNMDYVYRDPRMKRGKSNFIPKPAERAANHHRPRPQVSKRPPPPPRQELPRLPDYGGDVFLSDELRRRRRPGDEFYNINITISDLVPLDRKIDEHRVEACISRTYNISKYPKTSVIIPFHNEGLSMLLRTIYSILNNTPDQMLAEIIIVDDFSDNSDNQVLLENYIAGMKTDKVKILRNKKREGLMRTRQFGANAATGEILVFEDSHSESHVQWLEPIVEELLKHPNTVVQPAIGNINSRNFRLSHPNMDEAPRTGFSWTMRLIWMPTPPGYDTKSGDAFPVPTLAGCVFAVRKDFFQKLGGFDVNFDLWGGENFEVPIRAWVCGGRVVTLPCSVVYHTFRQHTYGKEQKDGEIVKNLARAAELWFGPHKYWFYHSMRGQSILRENEMQAIQNRKYELQQLGLQCKSFDWFLNNVLTDLKPPPPDALFHGQLYFPGQFGGGLGMNRNKNLILGKTNPHRIVPDLTFTLNRKGQFVHEPSGFCVIPNEGNNGVHGARCQAYQNGKWSFKPKGRLESYIKGSMIYTLQDGSTRCLQYAPPFNKMKNWPPNDVSPSLERCLDRRQEQQTWAWTYQFFNQGPEQKA